MKRLKIRHSKGSHKGDNGKVLIVGGSKEYVGALALAGLAALRTGVDTVVIAAPERVAWAINSLSPDLITRKFEGDYLRLRHAGEILRLAKKFDVVLIGNGLGTKKETQCFVKKVVKKIDKAKVIDADGIKAISLKEVKNAIITPHRKEFELLLKNSKIKEMELKRSLGSNVILLKGRIDKIISRDKISYNKTGNEGMTVSGTGDVLAGLCAGFLAQTKDAFKSACYAAYINGSLGDLLKRKKGYSFIASDLVEDLKRVKKTKER
jgi:NAD(P)H-hydrate epimerase